MHLLYTHTQADTEDAKGEDVGYYASIHKVPVSGIFAVEAFLKITANSIKTRFSLHLQYFQKEAAHQHLPLVTSPPFLGAAWLFPCRSSNARSHASEAALT